MSILVLLVGLVLFSSKGLSKLQTHCKICPEDFTYFSKENRCFRAFTGRESWEDAVETCSKHKSHLVVIRNASDSDLLNKVIDQLKGSCVSKFLNHPTFWTAGRRRCSNSPFVWAPNHGIRVDMEFTNWLPDEPDNLGGNVCLQFVSDESNQLGWSDTPCAHENCFVCEIDM